MSAEAAPASVQCDGSEPLGWLPEQSEEQLELGFRIIQNAYLSKNKTQKDKI